MLKSFSRKQATTALSSAEAELIALVEASKEAVYVALLMETLVFGLEKQQETGSFHLVFLSDSEAAISISAMSGLFEKSPTFRVASPLLARACHEWSVGFALDFWRTESI